MKEVLEETFEYPQEMLIIVDKFKESMTKSIERELIDQMTSRIGMVITAITDKVGPDINLDMVNKIVGFLKISPVYNDIIITTNRAVDIYLNNPDVRNEVTRINNIPWQFVMALKSQNVRPAIHALIGLNTYNIVRYTYFEGPNYEIDKNGLADDTLSSILGMYIDDAEGFFASESDYIGKGFHHGLITELKDWSIKVELQLKENQKGVNRVVVTDELVDLFKKSPELYDKAVTPVTWDDLTLWKKIHLRCYTSLQRWKYRIKSLLS